MEYILKTEALTKQYNKRNAIVNVDIAVRLGAVYGLVGRNGAGKTTILKILGGLAKIISSHILGELSKIATDFGIIHNGVLIEQISKEQLFEKFGKNETDVQDAFEAYYFDLTGGREDA